LRVQTTEEMKRELAVVAEFARVAKELKEVPKDERTKVLQAKLRLLELPSSFLLPYNPKYAFAVHTALRFICAHCAAAGAVIADCVQVRGVEAAR
jgi:hypothetical protein